ncbi:hypothetical protein [Shimia sp. SDUM112013]|uniref:hypothetical protein n=1 Tax=Shimia sp. SDUM112013 TaxID=3136160 RepID=UPI0032F0537B
MDQVQEFRALAEDWVNQGYPRHNQRSPLNSICLPVNDAARNVAASRKADEREGSLVQLIGNKLFDSV